MLCDIVGILQYSVVSDNMSLRVYPHKIANHAVMMLIGSAGDLATF